MASASPASSRNITQYDFLDEPVMVGDTQPPTLPATSPFLNLPLGSLGNKVSRDAGELFHLFFKHNLKADIGFTLREFEKKRGMAPQKTLESAYEVLQLAHKSHANSQQIFDRCTASVSTISADCCQLIKSQLSRHTTYQEDRIQAAAVREDRRHKDKARFDQFYEEERQRVDAEFSELILTLDELYTSKFQYVPSEENSRHSDERLKEIRREVLLQQLAIVQKRRADRKAKRRLAKERKAALLATTQKEEEEAKKAEESPSVEAQSTPSVASANDQPLAVAEEKTTTSLPPQETVNTEAQAEEEKQEEKQERPGI